MASVRELARMNASRRTSIGSGYAKERGVQRLELHQLVVRHVSSSD